MVKKIIVYCDFDGTITREDIGHHIFQFFSKDKENTELFEKKWRQGIISSKENLENFYSQDIFEREKLARFILKHEIDPFFKSFCNYLKIKEIPLIILSDGHSFYIDLIKEKYQIDVPFYYNLSFFKNGELKLKFPYLDFGCGRCGNCKVYHINHLSANNYFTIYIGDGFSDRYPAYYCNLLFAKGHLKRILEKKQIPFIPYKNFNDIQNWFYVNGGNIFDYEKEAELHEHSIKIFGNEKK